MDREVELPPLTGTPQRSLTIRNNKCECVLCLVGGGVVLEGFSCGVGCLDIVHDVGGPTGSDLVLSHCWV